jgi:GT2 family glycosyltransferase
MGKTSSARGLVSRLLSRLRRFGPFQAIRVSARARISKYKLALGKWKVKWFSVNAWNKKYTLDVQKWRERFVSAIAPVDQYRLEIEKWKKRFTDREASRSAYAAELLAKIAVLEGIIEKSTRYVPGQNAAPPRAFRSPGGKPRAIVSFVIGTYNRLELLKLALKSVRDQQTEQPTEIIVVDGGSTDGTPEWLLQQTDIITIVQHNRVAEENFQRRRSWGYFMNLGFRAAEGKWICMISDDCILHPDCISSSINHASKLEEAGHHVGGVAFYFRDWPKASRYFVQRTLGGKLMVNHGLFLKDALLDVGYVEEDIYDFYKADSDLSLKLWHLDYEIVSCPQSLVEHLYLPSEELRLGNNATLVEDRTRLFARWKRAIGSVDQSGIPEQPYQDFLDHEDHTGLADSFLPFVEQDEASLRERASR